MTDQIAKAIQHFKGKVTEYYLPSLKSNANNDSTREKQVMLNKTRNCYSQHIFNKNKICPSHQLSPQSHSIKKQNNEIIEFEQNNLSNNSININELIIQTKKEIQQKNKQYLKEIGQIRKSFEMKAKIRNKYRKERKHSSSSQELYEKCFDETLKEINKEIKDQQMLPITLDSKELYRKNSSLIKNKSKPLRSQIFSKILQSENKFFKEKSDSIIKLMKQSSTQLVEQVTAQFQQVHQIDKEKQLQRSKERDEGKQELIKCLRFKEQGKLIRLLQNKTTLKMQQKQNDKIIETNTNLEPTELNYTFQRPNKTRSSSFNCVLPKIQQKQQNQDKNTYSKRYQIKKRIQSMHEGSLDLSAILKSS